MWDGPIGEEALRWVHIAPQSHPYPMATNQPDDDFPELENEEVIVENTAKRLVFTHSFDEGGQMGEDVTSAHTTLAVTSDGRVFLWGTTPWVYLPPSPPLANTF